MMSNWFPSTPGSFAAVRSRWVGSFGVLGPGCGGVELVCMWVGIPDYGEMSNGLYQIRDVDLTQGRGDAGAQRVLISRQDAEGAKKVTKEV